MENLWFMAPFVFGESFLLLKPLCKERRHEGLRGEHTWQWPLTVACCADRAVPGSSTGEPWEWGGSLSHLGSGDCLDFC